MGDSKVEPQPATDETTFDLTIGGSVSSVAKAGGHPPKHAVPVPPPPVRPLQGKVKPVRPDSTSAKLWEVQSARREYLQVSIKLGRKSEHARRAPPKLPLRFIGTLSQAKTQPSDYTIEEIIGEGGMGVIYQAKQGCLNRSVALKALRPDAATDESSKELFLAEAMVTGDLDHPNIVPVHELGTNADGQLFYAMKYVQGTAWREVLPDKTQEENLDILLRVADAVAFAHSRGVLHCDLKPDNVMLGNYGEVFVMDWGLAVSMRDLAEAVALGEDTNLGGTPVYLPPEFANHELRKVGPASDIYLLGGLLYEILTGRPPHFAESMSQVILEAGRNEIPPIIGHPEFAEIALRALATQPEDRYATVKDFQNDVRSCRRHLDSLRLSETAGNFLARGEEYGLYQDYSRAVHAFEHALDLWDGNEVARLGQAAAQLSYARCATHRDDLDLADSLLDPANLEHQPLRREIESRRHERQHRQVVLQRMRVGLALLAVVTIVSLAAAHAYIQAQRQIAEYESFINGTRLAVDRLMSGDWDEVDSISTRLLKPQAGWEWEWLDQNSRLPPLPPGPPTVPVLLSRTSTSGQMTAFLRRDGNVEFHLQDKTWTWPAGPDIKDFRLVSNPDGQTNQLVTWDGHQIAFADAVSGARLATTVLSPSESLPGVLSPDGSLVLLLNARGNPTILATNAVASPVSTLQLPEGSQVVTGAFSPDNTHIALITLPVGRVGIWNVKDGRNLHPGPEDRGGHGNPLNHLEYLPDGIGLLVSNFDQAVADIHTLTMTPRLTLPFPSAPTAFAGSPDSRFLAAGTGTGEFQVQDLTTGDLIWRTHLPGTAIESIAFHQNPEAVMIADTTGRIVELPLVKRQPWRTVWVDRFPGLELAFSPDGQSLFVGEQNNTLSQVPLNRNPPVPIAQPPDLHLFPRSGLAMVHEASGTFLLEATQTGLLSVDAKTNQVAPWTSGFPVTALAGSADGQWIATASKNHLRVFAVAGHRQVAEWDLPTDVITLVQWIPGGLHLAVACADGTTFIVDPIRKTVLQRLQQTDVIHALAASPDGRHLVTASKDRSVDVWNLASGKLEHSLEGHEHVVLSMAYAPDQSRLFTASADGRVHIFDLKTYRQIVSFQAHRGAAVQLLISPDGSTLITSGTDGEIRLWPGTRTPAAWN